MFNVVEVNQDVHKSLEKRGKVQRNCLGYYSFQDLTLRVTAFCKVVTAPNSY